MKVSFLKVGMNEIVNLVFNVNKKYGSVVIVMFFVLYYF